jgi:hypothetical protein
MGFILPIIAALTAAFNVWKQERAIYNKPEMAKNELDKARQAAVDAINNADAVLANTKATPEQHAEALRIIRLAHS